MARSLSALTLISAWHQISGPGFPSIQATDCHGKSHQTLEWSPLFPKQSNQNRNSREHLRLTFVPNELAGAELKSCAEFSARSEPRARVRRQLFRVQLSQCDLAVRTPQVTLFRVRLPSGTAD